MTDLTKFVLWGLAGVVALNILKYYAVAWWAAPKGDGCWVGSISLIVGNGRKVTVYKDRFTSAVKAKAFIANKISEWDIADQGWVITHLILYDEHWKLPSHATEHLDILPDQWVTFVQATYPDFVKRNTVVVEYDDDDHWENFR